MSTNVGLLVESCNFKILNITINNITIEANYISDMSIDWNGSFRIFGYCTINDHQDLVNTMLENPGEVMLVTLIDNHEDTFVRQFSIVSSSESKEQDFKSITLKFQDTVSFLLQNTFVGKSYAETTLVDVVKDYMKLEVNKQIDGFPLELIASKSRKLSNFVVPLHIDFLTFIEIEFSKEGIWFYQIRDKILIGDEYEPLPTHEFPYTQTGSRDLYGFNILEYNLTFNDVKSSSAMQKPIVVAYNKNTKSINRYDKSLPDFLEDYNTGGVVKNSQLTHGARINSKEYLIDTNKYDHNLFKYNTQMYIIVPGNINYSLLFKIVDVRLSGAAYTTETRESGDIRLSGKYQIARVEDKFIAGQKFVQRLTLRRVNEGKQ